MADDWVDKTGDELARWAAERGPDIDVNGARMLLEIAAESLGLAGPGELTPDGLKALLLEKFPGMVLLGEEDVPSVIAVAGSVVDFLRDTGAVPDERAAALRAELARLTPEFTRVVAEIDEGEQEAAADMIAGMMAGEGVDLDDEAAVGRWVRDFESLPEEERFSRAAAYLREADELVVPPVRLAPEPELAAAARDSGLADLALALADRVTGLPVTDENEPSPGDARAAAEDLDLSAVRRRADGRRAGPAAGMADLPELDRLWWAAMHAGVLDVRDGRVAAGPARADLEGGADHAALATWLKLLESMVVADPGPDERLDPFQLVRGELTGVLIRLYEQDEPGTRDELLDAFLDHIEASYEVDEPDALAAALDHALDIEVQNLLEWDVLDAEVDVAEGGDEDDVDDDDYDGGDRLALTPLGVWGVRELLLGDGFMAPVVGELSHAPAADLVDGLTWHREDTADEEIDRWLAARGPLDAAAELVALMPAAGPGPRNLAAAVLHRLGAEAEPVVRDALDDPASRPYATLWLAEHGDASVVLDPDDMMWVFVDTVAGMLESSEPAAAVTAALADAPPEADLGAMVEDMWQVDHPEVTAVLEALGAHHPDKAVAKAARKAAFKCRSRPRPS